MNLINQTKDYLLILLSQKSLRFLLPFIFAKRISNAKEKTKNFKLRLNPKIYKHKLVVVYRISPHPNSKTPIFANDKFKLVKFCLDSFVKAFLKQKPFIIFLLDSCPVKYEKLIKSYKNLAFQIIKLDNFGNLPTLHLQLKIGEKLKLQQYVYLAEDDYFYLSQAGGILIKVLEKYEFVSLYDHPDNYQFNKTRPKKAWSSAQSTCLTFGSQVSALKKYINTFYKYPFSCPIWHSLREKNLKLYRPVPSLATHMQKYKLAPNIDWSKFFNT